MNSCQTIGTDQNGLLLNGLDGGNPLAFLAALGTLRVLNHAWPDRDIKMAWTDRAGPRWTPVLISGDVALQNTDNDRETVLDELDKSLIRNYEDHPVSNILERRSNDLVEQRDLFCQVVAQATTDNRDAIDWLAAITSDLAPDATSQIQTVRRDYFVGNLKNIMANTSRDDLERSLFHLWDYADALANQSLHIDPSEDRRHAYQWHQPSGDPTAKQRGGMLGANRLMIAAFPFFPSIAMGDKLQTRGFTGTRANNTRWTWPIWTCPLDCQIIGTALATAELQQLKPDIHRARQMGLAAVFRTHRILVGKTPNFSPARAVG